MRIAPITALFSIVAIATPAVAAPPELQDSPYGLPALARSDFNRLAAVAGLPLFWRTDDKTPSRLDPDELAILGGTAKRKSWVLPNGRNRPNNERFTKEFEEAYRQLVELRRLEAVRAELGQGRPTLVETDLGALASEDQTIVRSLERIAPLIDALYQKQQGSLGMIDRVPADDVASRALIARNQGPWCLAPLTQDDPFCNALADFSDTSTFSWPEGVEVDQAFCEKMAAEPNGKALIAPFTVVRKAKKGYRTEPYHQAYRDHAGPIAAALDATAALVKSSGEAPFKAYLEATAKAFRDDSWEAADEAWAAMSAENSKYYLRVGPDETYWDPCGVKAGYHMSFALVDTSALDWKRKLTTVRSELEERLAKLIGAPYQAREVSFELPEFINIVVNAGDSRSPMGATIGQSLPNFGKVAEESRGRTVAMVNLYTDADSLTDLEARNRSLFSPATFAAATKDAGPDRLGTVLHEATHNLGPNGSYRVGGKTGDQIFGGTTDAILEELKAQTGALYYLPFLKEKGLIDDATLRASYVSALSWSMGHISRGMFTGGGHPKTYSQLSAIQLGELLESGAVRWIEGGDVDPGRFDIDFAKIGGAVEALMRHVSRIRATGDVAAAKKLIDKHIGPEGLARIHVDLITERVLRHPKASFVYGFKD